MNIVRTMAAMCLVAFASGAHAEMTRFAISCPGPTEDRGHELSGSDRRYGMTAEVRPGETRKECRTLAEVVPIGSVGCRITPYHEVHGWICASDTPCADVTFGKVEFTVTRDNQSGMTQECVTIANASRFPRRIQIFVRRQ